jgi:LmbE family N-acetylglucosaminyl deacetylase
MAECLRKRMKRFTMGILLVALFARNAGAQTAQRVHAADERYKVDILVVVAHPDDEGGVTPYLARAIYDLHKRVAVVYGTRGGSGGNDLNREHGAALADVREIEARQACAALGISNVWFLGGKDTASQNVLNSLAAWGHGASLEELVRIVRLTRPEVMISWLPGVFVGENHGDHQASGVLATEAFDLAADATAFPAQIAGASRRLEPYLENLTPWQPKKLYFFSDANNQKQFAGLGPAYSVREVSLAKKMPYWRLAFDAAKPHLTQFPEDIERLSKMSNEQLEKMMMDPDAGWWNDPDTLIFGKGGASGGIAGDVFSGITPGEEVPGVVLHRQLASILPAAQEPQIILGGPWLFYDEFRQAHGLTALPKLMIAEIGIKSGSMLGIPLVVIHTGGGGAEISLKAIVPDGWKVTGGDGPLALPAERRTALRVDVQTPELSADALKNAKPQDIVVQLLVNGKLSGAVHLNVLLRASGLPQ